VQGKSPAPRRHPLKIHHKKIHHEGTENTKKSEKRFYPQITQIIYWVLV